ncbi:transcription elongation factor GreA [Entomoplasma freundtii]|uniref:Transcription elongation factor GreA n=1 Tax=Entomoplasma freundtii TaxID=74700 RepID=A0A2K8NRT1_9MOLU|nr:transcription elongation factor GreA [Entomoplasma freundtii]ATZ16555.1 transcription elongation factor GreA [Entomoplasma freundtii]TDY58279.1 transcription elongation factor GreA [Entomoplasma freundtii]
MSKEIILTIEGLEEKKQELRHLIEDVRPEVIRELVEARNQGDLSENADYDAARNRQAEVEARIKEVEAMISQAKIIDTRSSKKGEAKIGSTITYHKRGSDIDQVVKIVGAVEADPFQGLISNESPLAKAILGHNEGTIVEVKEVKVPYKIVIKQVK